MGQGLRGIIVCAVDILVLLAILDRECTRVVGASYTGQHTIQPVQHTLVDRRHRTEVRLYRVYTDKAGRVVVSEVVH